MDDIKNFAVKNNEPEVVLLSPQEYVEIMEDQELLSLSLERLEHYDPSSVACWHIGNQAIQRTA